MKTLEPVDEAQPKPLDEDDIMFDEWLGECAKRFDRINEYNEHNGRPFGNAEKALVYDRAIRPFHYFKEGVTRNQITPRQFYHIIREFEDEPTKQKFITWAAAHDDINMTQGTPEHVVASLTKDQASEFLNMIWG